MSRPGGRLTSLAQKRSAIWSGANFAGLTRWPSRPGQARSQNFSPPICAATPNTRQGEWGNILVLRSEVITLAYGRPKPKPRKSRSPYAVTDARLYPRMELLIQSGKAASSYAVAKAVAHRAEGTEMGDHNVRRLQPGFDKARNR